MTGVGAYRIREAHRDDLDTLVAFTVREAQEAEGVTASTEAVRRGVQAGLVDPTVARYWVAEAPDGQVVGATSSVWEWSNIRGGHYWWIQSLFIVPEHRGKGLVGALLGHVASAARLAGALNLRLYVHASNTRARAAYRRCGFVEAPYTIMTRQLDGD